MNVEQFFKNYQNSFPLFEKMFRGRSHKLRKQLFYCRIMIEGVIIEGIINIGRNLLERKDICGNFKL